MSVLKISINIQKIFTNYLRFFEYYKKSILNIKLSVSMIVSQSQWQIFHQPSVGVRLRPLNQIVPRDRRSKI